MSGVPVDFSAMFAAMAIEDPAEVRDRRQDIIKELGGSHPAMCKFFSNLKVPVEADGEPIALLKAAKGGNSIAVKWLAITEFMVQTLLNEGERLDSVVRQREVTIQATKEALTAALTANAARGSTTNDELNDWEESIPMPHPTPFTGDTEDKAERTREYQAWREGVRGF